MSEEAFGIRVPGGDPGALDGAASDLSGASGSLERSTTSVRDSATATPSWEGFGNLQFFNSCTVQADTIALGVDVLDTASKIVAEVAEKLRAAKKAAKLAVDDAQEADTRRGRAEDAMQDAEQEALAARLRATFARTTAASSSPLLPNPAASAEETHALKQAEAADQQAAAAQRSRDRAQGDLENAQRAGNNAEREYTDAADDAARMIASLIQLTPQFIGSTGAAAAATGGPGAPEALVPFSTRTGGAPTGDEEADEDSGGFGKLVGDLSGWNDVKGAVKDIGDGNVGGALVHVAFAAPTPFGKAAKVGKLGKEGLSHTDDAAKVGKGADDAAKVGKGGAETVAKNPTSAKATVHGVERLQEGKFTDDVLASVKAGYVTRQADGATVYVRKNAADRFDLVVEGDKGIITAHRDWPQKSVDGLARNYGWESWPP